MNETTQALLMWDLYKALFSIGIALIVGGLIMGFGKYF